MNRTITSTGPTSATTSEIFEYLAIWNGLYVAAGLFIASTIAGWTPSWKAELGVGLLAVATYLLDRVKVTRKSFDPADDIAHPQRAIYIRRHAPIVRLMMVVCCLGAVAMLGMVHPIGLILVPGAFVGVAFYARSRRYGWRPKDALVIKNLSVAVSMAALCVAVAWLERLGLTLPTAQTLVALGAAFGFLLLHVFADAAICDIDDVEGDATFGTRTLPLVIGARGVWWMAVGVQTIAGAALACAAVMSPVDMQIALLWAVGLLLGTVLVMAFQRGTYRPAIDLKMPVVAVIVGFILLWPGG